MDKYTKEQRSEYNKYYFSEIKERRKVDKKFNQEYRLKNAKAQQKFREKKKDETNQRYNTN